MKVEKKELKERTFTPYQIVIQIDNEVDQEALVTNLKDAKEYGEGMYGIEQMYLERLKTSSYPYTALNQLIETILTHIK